MRQEEREEKKQQELRRWKKSHPSYFSFIRLLFYTLLSGWSGGRFEASRACKMCVFFLLPADSPRKGFSLLPEPSVVTLFFASCVLRLVVAWDCLCWQRTMFSMSDVHQTNYHWPWHCHHRHLFRTSGVSPLSSVPYFCRGGWRGYLPLHEKYTCPCLQSLLRDSCFPWCGLFPGGAQLWLGLAWPRWLTLLVDPVSTWAWWLDFSWFFIFTWITLDWVQLPTARLSREGPTT